MKLSRAEQETVILYNEDEKTASVCTCSPTLIRQLDAFCVQGRAITYIRKDKYGKRYIIPKQWIRFRPPRELSDAQRNKLIDNARANFHLGK